VLSDEAGVPAPPAPHPLVQHTSKPTTEPPSRCRIRIPPSSLRMQPTHQVRKYSKGWLLGQEGSPAACASCTSNRAPCTIPFCSSIRPAWVHAVFRS
jgi:hypothetical protein